MTTSRILKAMKKIRYAILALAALAAAACSTKEFDEISELNLSRCLAPMNLEARVSASLGDVVMFSWDVSKDAEAYTLFISTDEAMTQVILTEPVLPSQVPYQKKLEADKTYWFAVQATAQGKADSKVTGCEKSFKTFAVKDNLFLKVADRTAASISLAWSKDVADYTEVDRIEYGLPGQDPAGTVTLTDADIAAAAATVDGLTPSTEYVFTLYYLSASRGQVDAWTTPDINGTTEVSTTEALLNAVKTAGAKILLKLDGSPYDIEALDISNGFTLLGEESADGTKPVVQGEFHFADTWAPGADLYFEGVDFDGAPTAASPSGFGFAIQNKNGGALKDKNIGNITYKNCVIQNYTKGLIYEWGNNLVLGEVTYDGCDIHDINTDGTVGGDVFDIRQATTVAKLTFVNNTIWQGMRTFVRFDAGSIGALVFENNTLQNLNFVDNANNAGVFGLQITPGSFSFKNNLFLNFTGKAVLAGANAKYVPAGDLGVAAANNWFYNLPKNDAGSVIYFTDNFTQAQAAGTILEADPCYNAPGGYFNLLSDSDIAGKKVGAPKWWTPFVEEPEDLTLNVLAGNKTWNLANAKYFSGTVKKEMVRDDLFLSGGETNAIVAGGGQLRFETPVVTNRQGVPALSYVAFKVPGPGSVLVKAADPDATGNHLVVGVGPVDGSSVALKGGASAMADMVTPTKIVITSITEESLVYVFPSGPVAIEKLAWSTDVTPVNTALPTPEPVADPTSITAGDAADITVSWEPVTGAASYSVVFSGKSYTVSEGTEYVIGGTTTGMLDAGSYKVEVYANPGADDIYNTESAAGVAAFAVLPKGGGGEDEAFVVTNTEQLLAAIGASKPEITLAPGSYDLDGVLTVTAPLSLIGQDGAEVTGAFKLSGEVGTFSIDNLKMLAGGQGVFIDLDGDNGAKAESVTVKNTVIDGYAKSVIYAANKADMFNLGDILFQAVEVYNQGTGQGMFDLRNGVYGSFKLIESTLTGGRDFLRIDATCTIPTVLVGSNTMYNLNTSKNGNGIFYVRAAASDYKVEKNLLLGMTSGTIIGKSGAAVPKMKGNYYFDCNDDVFFTGVMDKDEALGGQGVILTVDPVKDAANKDFTLVNAVVMSAGVGAPKWNPSVVPPSGGSSMTVASAEEFQAAVDAGKADITFAAGTYDLSAANITLTAGMHLAGEPGAEITVSQFDVAEGELGNILIENLKIHGGSNNLISVGAASLVNNLTVRNCEIDGVGKSVFYGNAEGSSFAAVVFSNDVFSGLVGGQGTIDIRKGAYSVVTVENCTVVGGRDFIRADAGKVTGAVNIVNNTFDGVTLNNGNGILYVRSTPERYVFKNNLFLNENGENNLLSKASGSGVSVPTSVANNYFYGCTAAKFWTGVIDQEVALANGGVILSADPVKDAANRDYTLVDALCLASNVGAARWNPNAGRVSSEITVASVAELTTAIDAGKAAITLKAGTYDLAEAAESRVITLIAPLSLTGQGSVEIVGGFKFGAGTTSFTAENIRFSGADKAVSNAFEIAEAVEMSKIQFTGCDIYAYSKSLFYGNGADSKVAVFDFQKNLVHGFGTGQGMIDIRKGAYTAITVSKNTFYDGGRDFIRCDKEIAGSIAITNNTFGACSIDAGNGLLWVRSCASDPSKYTVSRNLFLNLAGGDGKTILAKKDATVPTMNANYFFNVAEGFFGAAIDQATATAGGAVLEADPCANSAEFNFKLTDPALRSADIGDPRWNSASPNYSKKR